MFKGERDYPAGTEMVRLTPVSEKEPWWRGILAHMGDVGMVTGPHAALAQYVRVYKKIPVDLLANQTNRFPADVREDLTHLVPAVEIYTQD